MKAFRTLFFIASVLVVLGTVCFLFPKGGVGFGPFNVRFPELARVLNPQRILDIEAYLARQDSIKAVLKDRQDSLDYFRRQVDSSDTRFAFPNGDDSFFDDLFCQLEQAQLAGRTVRILHYGDSQIEMDRMTDRLRKYMQERFGGGGPGLVPFAPLIPSLSYSVYGTGSLVRQSPYGDTLVQRANGNYGPMVQDYRVDGVATSTLTAGTHKRCDSRLRQFSRFKMLFNNLSDTLSARFDVRGGGYGDTRVCAEQGVRAMDWMLDSATTSVSISVSGHADIYGIMVDDGPGVAVDNIPMRGCSGHQFTQINQDQLTAAYAQMDVGLIILQFGGNSVPYINGPASVATYCAGMGKQIDRLRQCCPNAKILFVGPSDMSTRRDGELKTYPCIPQLVEALQDTVNAHGAAFWSIYRAMGGYNSMVAWVEEGLSGPDYIHFSQRGADIMGDRLAAAFDDVYQIYIMRKNVQNVR